MRTRYLGILAVSVTVATGSEIAARDMYMEYPQRRRDERQ